MLGGLRTLAALQAGSGLEFQLKLNLDDFSLKIWYRLVPILPVLLDVISYLLRNYKLYR